jgi:aspartate aminotransferase
VREYAYYDAANHALDFDGLLASLNEAQAGDVVLFHGCCHNPTGIDPTLDQWQQLAQLSVEKGWLPLFDFAYQGFARGLEEDAEGLRALLLCIKSCWSPAPTRKTLACTTSASAPALWSPRIRRL